VEAESCVRGTWKGPFDNNACGEGARLDYMYHQCAVSSRHAFIATAGLLALLLLAIGTILCCCCCSSSSRDRDDLLTHQQYQRRSSAYYNWNRTPVNRTRSRNPIHTWSTDTTGSIFIPAPPNSRGVKPAMDVLGGGRYGSLSDSPGRVIGANGSSNSREEDYLSPSKWESRRADLLKKYGRGSDGSS